MDHIATTAEALLNAHVAYILRQLDSANLHDFLVEEIDRILANAPELTLNDVVTPDMIKDTVQSYAVKLDLGAGVLDVIGDIARAAYSHDIHDRTTLADLMPDRHLAALVDKALELTHVRERLVRELVANPLYAALASDVLYHGIRGYLWHSAGGLGAQPVLKLGQRMLRRAPAGLEDTIELNLRRYIQKSISAILTESERFLLQLDEDKLRDTLLDIWDDIKHMRVGVARDQLTSLDVEEFFVLCFEFWRDFREGEYFTALVNAGIDAFFKRYGDTTLDELLEEVGIRRYMLIEDAVRFVPPVLAVLNAKQLLEPTIRRHLEGFYLSPEAAGILAGKG